MVQEKIFWEETETPERELPMEMINFKPKLNFSKGTGRLQSVIKYFNFYKWQIVQ